MQVGDYVKLRKFYYKLDEPEDDDTWRVVEITEESIVVKKKNVGGLFTFRKDSVISVLDK